MFEMPFFKSVYAGYGNVSFPFRFKVDGGASEADIEHMKDLKTRSLLPSLFGKKNNQIL